MEIAEDILDQVEQYQSDFKSFAEDCLSVRDHNTKSIVPFKFRKGQRILDTIVEKQLSEQGYVRIIISKARRHGISTYVEARGYHETSMNLNTDAFIVAHESQATTTLFNMTKLYHERNPLAPNTQKSNAKEIIFDNDEGNGLKSSFKLATAGTPEAARGQGIHFLHDSEEPLWPQAEITLLSLLQCVPPPPTRSFVFREATSNGFGNPFQIDAFRIYAEGRFPFYEEDGFVYAYHNPEVSDTILVFLPWFVHEDYTKEFKSDVEKKELIEKVSAQVLDEQQMHWVDSEPLRVKKTNRLTWEQINWALWCLEENCRDNLDLFHQEYPATFLESFLSQGSNVFGRVLCDQLEGQCEPPAHTGEVLQIQGKPKIELKKNGHFQRWKPYDKKETYFMTVDVAGGKKEFEDRDKKTKEPDRTNIDVWNRRTGEQVAQWNGHKDYDLVADLVEIIGNMFGRCKAVVEQNNHGLAVTAFLRKLGYPQWERDKDQLGWLTTRATKPVMIDSAYMMLRDGGLQLNCKESVEELRVFIEESGKYGAAAGCKDDRVITIGIASQMMEQLPRHMDVKKKGQPKGFTNFLNKSKRGN